MADRGAHEPAGEQASRDQGSWGAVQPSSQQGSVQSTPTDRQGMSDQVQGGEAESGHATGQDMQGSYGGLQGGVRDGGSGQPDYTPDR